MVLVSNRSIVGEDVPLDGRKNGKHMAMGSNAGMAKHCKNKWHMPHVSVIYQSWTYYSDSKATGIRTVEKLSVVVKFIIVHTNSVKDRLYNVLSI